MSLKLFTVCCILLMATMALVHAQDALWQQRKRDDLRSNNIKFSVNHLDYSQLIPKVPDFTQIQNTLTVDEKEGMAYAVFFNTSTLHLLKVNLTNGTYSIRNLANDGISAQTNAEVYVAGAVLDEYALTVLLGTDTSSYMLKISIQDDNHVSSVNLDEYGKPYAISYSSNPETIIVAGSKLVGSFQKSALNYEIWNVEIRNSTSNKRVSSLVVPDEGGYVLYILTPQYLERIRVQKDGNRFTSSIEINIGQPQEMVTMRNNILAVTSTKPNGAAYLSIVSFDSGKILSTSEIVKPLSNSNQQLETRCDFPTLSLVSTLNSDDVYYNVEVSCEDYMRRVYNIFTTTVMKKGSDEILSQKIIPAPSTNAILGMTRIMKSETTFISKNIKLGYTIMDRNGKGIYTLSSNVIAKTCEILTSSNNRFYAFCWNGSNFSIESKKLP